jgi:hypothetical protein
MMAGSSGGSCVVGKRETGASVAGVKNNSSVREGKGRHGNTTGLEEINLAEEDMASKEEEEVMEARVGEDGADDGDGDDKGEEGDRGWSR